MILFHESSLQINKENFQNVKNLADLEKMKEDLDISKLTLDFFWAVDEYDIILVGEVADNVGTFRSIAT